MAQNPRLSDKMSREEQVGGEKKVPERSLGDVGLVVNIKMMMIMIMMMMMMMSPSGFSVMPPWS